MTLPATERDPRRPGRSRLSPRALSAAGRVASGDPLLPSPAMSGQPVLELLLGDVVRLRRRHPCGGETWLVDRLGADIGIRCETCGRHVLVERPALERRIAGFVRRGDPALSAARRRRSGRDRAPAGSRRDLPTRPRLDGRARRRRRRVEADAGALEVFRNRPFLLLWLSQVFTQIGGNMVLYGLTLIMLKSGAGNTAVSLLILSFLAPAVLFSAVAGVYVDRLDKRLVLVATNVLRAGLLVLLWLAGANLALLLLLNVLISTVTVFFAPAEASMIPQLSRGGCCCRRTACSR